MSNIRSISDLAQLRNLDEIKEGIKALRSSGKTIEQILDETKTLQNTETRKIIQSILGESDSNKNIIRNFITQNPKIIGTGVAVTGGAAAATVYGINRLKQAEEEKNKTNEKEYTIKSIKLDNNLLSLTNGYIIIDYTPIAKVCINDTITLSNIVSNIPDLNGTHTIVNVTSLGDLVIENPDNSIDDLIVTDLSSSKLKFTTTTECQLKIIDINTGKNIGDFFSSIVNPLANTASGTFGTILNNILGNPNTLLIGGGIVLLLLLRK